MTVFESCFAPKDFLPNCIQSSTRFGPEARVVPFCLRNPTSSFFCFLLFYVSDSLVSHRTGEAWSTPGSRERVSPRLCFCNVSSTSFSENRWPTHLHTAVLTLWFFCLSCGSVHKRSLIPIPTGKVLKIPVSYILFSTWPNLLILFSEYLSDPYEILYSNQVKNLTCSMIRFI